MGEKMKIKLAERMSGLEVSELRQKLRKNMERTDTFPFGFGNPAKESYPVAPLKKISQQLYESEPEDFLQYGQTAGYKPLREDLEKWMQEKYHMNAASNEIVIASGSSQAMDITVKILCNEGDEVLCEAQTFIGCVNAIRSYKAVPVGIPMDETGESIDLDLVEQKLQADTEKRIKLIYVIPTFQNPLGTSMPVEKRKRLVELAEKYQVFIFEDDPYGDLIYEGDPLPKLKSFDKEGVVIFAGSFSKILAPAARVAYIYADKNFTAPFIAAKGDADTHTNLYWQLMADHYIRFFDFESHIIELQNLYREKCALMLACLDKNCWPYLSYIKPKGGFFISCKVSEKIDCPYFMDQLIEKKVIVVPGNLMTTDGSGYDRFFRLSFTSSTKKEIVEGIYLIGEALKESVRRE